jgi:Holliday junction resolvasome RuvABC ATP-dependent DNA helicase subunit
MIGATTHEGRLNEPLRKRFPNSVRLRPYTRQEVTNIVVLAAKNQFGVNLKPEVAMRIACVSQGTPRVARNILRASHEVAKAYNSELSLAVINKTLMFEELDPLIGLNRAQRRYLIALATEGHMGAKGLAVMLDEQIETIEFAIEPFLMQEVELPQVGNNTQYDTGIMVKRTTKGREITPFGMRYLQLCEQLQNNGWLSGENLKVA